MEDARDAGAFKCSSSAQDGAEARRVLEKYQPQGVGWKAARRS